MTHWTPYEKASQGPAVLWKDLDPESEEQTEAKRKLLAEFSTAVAASGFPDLRTQGRLYYESSPPFGTLTNAWPFLAAVTCGNVVGGGSPSTRLLTLVGAISDQDWQRLVNGETLTCGELGVTTELQGLLEHEDTIEIGADRPFPDLYRHPMELFPKGVPGDVPIRVHSTRTRVMRSWPINGQELQGWTPTNDFVKDSFRLPLVGIDLNADPPTVRMSRGAYEQQQSRQRYRFGTRYDASVLIGLPNGLYVRYEGPSAAEGDPDTFLYSDLPQAYRDGLWQWACNDAIYRVTHPREFGITINGRGYTSATPAAAPTIPPPPSG